jgi:hypothetical protein
MNNPYQNTESLLPSFHSPKAFLQNINRHILYVILIIYGLFLIFSCIIWIITMSKMSPLCSSYIPYFFLFFLGSLSFLSMVVGNCVSLFKKKYSKNLINFCLGCLVVGIGLKIAFIVYSICIYDRSYGDCYLSGEKQAKYIAGCVIEILGLGGCFIFWKKEERMKIL